MPYDERSINELYESAEITPMGIQLEVNAEIFTTIYNLLSNMRSEEGIQQEDEKRLLHLWRKTIRAMAKVELRKGHGISMEKQIEMLKEAYAIETKYTADQLFSSVSSSKLTKEELEEVRRFSAEEMNTLFNSVIWPAMIKGKTGAQENPTAFIIAGQPGSGKTRMSSVIIDDYDGDIIQSMSDNFRGFHPRAKEVFQKYGRYCTYFSTKGSSKLTKEELEEVRRFSAEEMNTLFNSVIWPAMIKGKTGAQENPTAFIIAGQPGSGKTRMSSVIIDDYDGDIIQSMSDNFRGFHPRAKEVFQKYGRYCTYFSTKEGKYLSDLAMRKAAEEKYHILQEGSLDDSAHTMALISYLKEKGYTICVLLRACPKKDSWKAIHQLYLQQRLKAPGLSRLISKEQHDKACLSFLSATNDLINQNLMDRLIIKSPKGLLYDSDDMPTERVSDVLSKRIGK